MPDLLLTYIGVKSTHAVSGVAGGTVRHLIVGGGWVSGITSILAGLFTASYMTPSAYFAAIHYFPEWADPSTEGALGFLIGVTGMLLCEGAMIMVRKWSKNPVLPGVSKP